MNLISRYKSLIVGTVLTVLLLGAVSLPIPARAQTPTLVELQAVIQNLMQQIADLIAQQQGDGSGSTFCILTRDLTVGSEGADVRTLETFLNRKGYTVSTSGSGAPIADALFNANTRDALARYQAVSGVNPASGYLGPITRANINLQLTPADCATDDNENGSPYFRKIENIQTTYKVGESISLEAEAVEGDRTTIADASKGFNVRAYIFKGYNSHNESYLTPNPAGSHNARFNPQTLKWDIDMKAPETSGEYSLRVILERYGNHRTTRYFYFKVVDDEEDRDVSIDVDLISATAEASGIDGSGPGDMSLGLFRLKYKVTAVGGDVYVDQDCGVDSVVGVKYSFITGGVAMEGKACSLNSMGGSGEGGSVVTIREGESKEFDLRASSRAENGSGDVYLKLNKFTWSPSTSPVSYNYTNVSSLRTPSVFLRSYNGEVEENAEIIVSSPTGNNIFKSGDSMNVVYTWSGFPYSPAPRFNIDLYARDTKVDTIATNVTGSIFWTIPSNLITGDNFRVNVYSLGSGVNGWSGRFTINANEPVATPAIRGVNIDNYQTPWTNRTAKTIRWNYSDLPQTGLKFKVGLYTNLNGGMWGNSVFVNAVGTSGTLTTSLSPRIGEPYFNKDYFIMVRLYNADGTEFRPQGKRIETAGTQVFQVVPPTTGMVNKEDQLASIYNTLENMLEGLRK